MEEVLQEALERRFGLRQHTPRTQIGGNGSGHVATERLAGGDVGGEKPAIGNERLELGLVVPDRTAGSAHIDLDGLLPGGDTDDSHLFAATRTRTTRRLQALRARHDLSETLLIENTTQRTDCRRHTAALRTGSAELAGLRPSLLKLRTATRTDRFVQNRILHGICNIMLPDSFYYSMISRTYT